MLEAIHANMEGPMENRSIGGSAYYVLFVDDYRKMVFIFLGQKVMNLNILTNFIHSMKNRKIES